MMWFEIMWHGIIWCCTIWYDKIRWHDDIIRNDMIWYHVTYQDITWYDITWYDMAWYDITWRDMTWSELAPKRILILLLQWTNSDWVLRGIFINFKVDMSRKKVHDARRRCEVQIRIDKTQLYRSINCRTIICCVSRSFEISFADRVAITRKIESPCDIEYYSRDSHILISG
jgi:hypothetical protein